MTLHSKLCPHCGGNFVKLDGMIADGNGTWDNVYTVIACEDCGWINRIEPVDYLCPICEAVLVYHEWNCVVDGEETGERYKVLVCEKCGYKEDIV